jgi:hypothetical protein
MKAINIPLFASFLLQIYYSSSDTEILIKKSIEPCVLNESKRYHNKNKKVQSNKKKKKKSEEN